MSKPIRISEAFSLYRHMYIVMSNKSPKTEEAYIGTGKLLIRLFGDTYIGQLTYEEVRKWHHWLSGWQSPDTVRGNIICLRMVLKFLATEGYDVINYDRIIVAKRTKQKIKYLKQYEVEAFISEAGRRRRGYSSINRLRNVAIITFLYATGLRNSELCDMNRDDIRDRSFTVIGKSRDPRPVYITEAAEEAVNKYLEARTDNNKALFISHQTGNRITSKTLRDVFAFICARSDFEGVHPHTIRHSFATKLVANNVDLLFIGDLMGHTDLNTTRVYTHYENPKLKAIYEKAHQ